MVVLSPFELNVSFTKVFLFTSHILVVAVASNKLPPTHPIMLSQISVSGVISIFSVVSSVRFSVLYIVTLYIFLFPSFPITVQHTQTLLLKCQPQNIEAMLPTALGFPIGKRVTDHCTILVPKAVGFSQELLPP